MRPLLVFTLAALPYLNILPNKFVMDDLYQIEANPWIKEFPRVWQAFSTNMWGFERGASNYYRPHIHVFYALVHMVSGKNPWGYHLTNILFHAGTSMLVYLISLALLRERFGEKKAVLASIISALVFILHPIHTEAVAWASAISELSFSFFFFLAFYFWIKSEGRKPFLVLSSALVFFLSLLCKESAVMLPSVFLAYDLIFRRKEKFLFRYGSLAAGLVLYLILRVNGLGALMVSVEHGRGQVALSGWGYLMNIPPLFAVYIFKVLFPIKLNAVHLFHVKRLLEPATLLSLPVAVLYGLACLYALRRNRQEILFLLFFFALAILPALYIKGVCGNTWAERYLYLPSLGFSILVGYISTLFLEKENRTRTALSVLLLALLSFYAVSTVERTFIWRTNKSLWRDTLKKSPNVGIVYMGYGGALFEEGRFDEAEAAFNRALQFLPGDYELFNLLGRLYAEKGLLEKSEAFLRKAVALAPSYAEAHMSLGVTYTKQGHTAEAIKEFEAARRLLPQYPAPHFNLGLAYLEMGKPATAVRELKRLSVSSRETRNFITIFQSPLNSSG